METTRKPLENDDGTYNSECPFCGANIFRDKFENACPHLVLAHNNADILAEDFWYLRDVDTRVEVEKLRIELADFNGMNPNDREEYEEAIEEVDSSKILEAFKRVLESENASPQVQVLESVGSGCSGPPFPVEDTLIYME